jgi:hypothetical protein
MQATAASITRALDTASPSTAVVRELALFFAGVDVLALLTL